MMEQIWIPYCGAAPLPGDWLARWNGDPILLLAFAAVALVAWQRMEVAASFWAGLAILVLLFVSPLCALSSALFSVRVGHHVLLTAVAAPLLVWGLPRLRLRGTAALWAAFHILLFRSEEHTSELQSLMRISYAVFCLKKKIKEKRHANTKCIKL